MRYDKYDTHGAIHWDWYYRPEPGNGYRELVEDSIMPFIDNRERGTLLDIGCGDGLVSHLLDSFGYKVIGIEPELTGVDICKAKVPKMEVLHGGLEEVVIPPVDYMFSLNTIEHLKDPTYFTKVIPLVRKFSVIVTDNAVGHVPDPYHTQEFTMEELKDLFSDFEVKEVPLTNEAFIGVCVSQS